AVGREGVRLPAVRGRGRARASRRAAARRRARPRRATRARRDRLHPAVRRRGRGQRARHVRPSGRQDPRRARARDERPAARRRGRSACSWAASRLGQRHGGLPMNHEIDERELTAEVSLTLADGRLNPDAVGWAREPLVDTRGIARGRGRNKRWEYWNVTTPSHIVGLTVSSIDYAAVHEVWVFDRATQRSWHRSATVLP